MNQRFDFEEAFSRSVGWVTEAELQLLRGKRVAIAGLGGVGGAHLLALTRLGIGAFTIADLDTFELANFNRQAGASMQHLGRPKVDVMAEMALDINPELDLRRFPSGINDANVAEFLRDADVYIDGLDFFVMDTREAVFAACAARGIPAITAAPLGWGSALITFAPGSATFDEYFQMQGQTWEEKLRHFLVGLSPTALELTPLVDPTRLDIEHQRGPSTPVGALLCAALAATTAVKLLLKRGDVPLAPQSLHVDAYLNQCRLVDQPGGVGHPDLQARLLAMRKR